jgi:predicted nucleotide-binding protein
MPAKKATRAGKPTKPTTTTSRKNRNFPQHTVEDALTVSQKIQDENAARPFRRLLLSDALGIKPSSSNYKALLSSSFKYGLTDGTEKATEISLTKTGADATQTGDATRRLAAIRRAAMTPTIFGDFYRAYADRKLPSPDMMRKILVAEHHVPEDRANEAAETLIANGRFAELIRDVGGSPHVMLDTASAQVVVPDPGATDENETDDENVIENPPAPAAAPASPIQTVSVKEAPAAPTTRPIFVGHGKKKQPLEKLQKILTQFQIPHKVVVDEANLGRPISQKVRETMLQCGSAILIFTKDEQFQDEKGNPIWRPSENVVHELGAASFAYEDRVVIFKESGINFPSNFESVGYIEFEEDSIEAKTAELLKELIGFGLVRITPA